MELVTSFAEFLGMGKHGLYVWSSYAITAVSLLGLFIYLRRQRRARIAQVNNSVAMPQNNSAQVTITAHGEDS